MRRNRHAGNLASGGTGGAALARRRLTRARRMAGMNGPRQTAGNARVVAARAFAGGHHAWGRARGLAVRHRVATRVPPPPPPAETMTQFRRWCLPGKLGGGEGVRRVPARGEWRWAVEAAEAVTVGVVVAATVDGHEEERRGKNEYTHVRTHTR